MTFEEIVFPRCRATTGGTKDLGTGVLEIRERYVDFTTRR